MRLMEGQHAVKLTAGQAEQPPAGAAEEYYERGKGTVSRDWVGRDAAHRRSHRPDRPGSNAPVCVNANHPFAVTEMMMPVLPVVRAANVEEAIAPRGSQLEGAVTTLRRCTAQYQHNQMANAIDTPAFSLSKRAAYCCRIKRRRLTTMTITTPPAMGDQRVPAAVDACWWMRVSHCMGGTSHGARRTTWLTPRLQKAAALWTRRPPPATQSPWLGIDFKHLRRGDDGNACLVAVCLDCRRCA